MKTKQVIDHIVNWLDTYLDQSGLKGFTIGVSGGIDSAVTSTLCARTGRDVLALNMPIYQAKDQVSCSGAHIAWLEQKFDNVKGIILSFRLFSIRSSKAFLILFKMT